MTTLVVLYNKKVVIYTFFIIVRSVFSITFYNFLTNEQSYEASLNVREITVERKFRTIAIIFRSPKSFLFKRFVAERLILYAISKNDLKIKFAYYTFQKWFGKKN